MKDIFKYPLDAATSYIDPLYVGSAADGFQKRIQDLKDGNYKAWDGTAPSNGVNTLMKNVSKFNNYYDNRGDYNITIDDMYQYPLLHGNVTVTQGNDITATVTSGDINGHFTAAGHGLTQGDVIAASLFNGDYTVLNGNNYYVQYTDVNTFRLSVDAGFTQIVSLYDLKEATVAYSNEYVLGTTTPHNMSNGMPVTLSGLNGSWSVFNGLDVYAKVDSSSALKFTTDAAGTTEYKVHELGTSTVTSGSITQPTVFTGANNLVNGMSVDISNFDGAMTEYNGTIGTVESVTSTTFNMRDAAGDLIGFNIDEHVFNGYGAYGSIQSVIIPDSMSGAMILSYPQLPQAKSFDRWTQGGTQSIPYDTLYTDTYIGSEYYLHPVTPTSKTYYVSKLNSDDPINRHTLEDWLTDVSIGPEFARRCDKFDMNINHGLNTVEITNWANTDGMQQPNDGPRPLTFEDHPTFLMTTEDGIVTRDLLYAELDSGNNYRLYTDQAKTNLVSDWSDYLMTLDGLYAESYMRLYNKNTPILDDSGLHDLATSAYRGYFTGTPNGSFIDSKLWNGYTSSNLVTDSGLTLNGEVLYDLNVSGSAYYDNADYEFVFNNVYNEFGGTNGSEGFWAEDISACHTLFQDILATTPNPTGEQNTLSSIYTSYGIMQFKYHNAVEGRYYFQLYTDEDMELISGQFGPLTLKTNGQLLTYDFSEDLPTEDITNFVNATTQSADGLASGFRVPENYNLTHDASFKIDAPNANENKVEFKDNYLVNGTPVTNSLILPVSIGPIDTSFVANPMYSKLKAGMRVIYNTKSYVVSGGKVIATNYSGAGGILPVYYVDGATNEREVHDLGNYKYFYLHDITDDRTSDFLVDYTVKVDFKYADDVAGSQYSPYELESEYTVKDWQKTLLPTVPFVVSNTPLLRYTESGNLSRLGAVDNGRLIGPTWDTHTVEYSNDSITTGYVEEDYTSQGAWDQTTTNFVNSTTGYIEEVDTTSSWVYASLNPVLATAGQAFFNAPDTYELTNITLMIPGNNTYTYLNSSGVTTPGAEVGIDYMPAGANYSVIHPGTPDITLNTDSNGRLTSATLNSNLSGYNGAQELIFNIHALADQYVPPAPNTAAQEDVFDTQNQWTVSGWVSGDEKVFGDGIIPTSAVVTYNQPSTTNKSQNGTKYVRSSGFVKTTLEVSYDCLTEDQFQILNSDVQAARGQATTFQLRHSQWGEKVLHFGNTKSTNSPKIVQPYTAGETLVKLGGFQSNESEVFKKGEMLVALWTNNGGLSTVLNTVDANVYGEAEIRVAYGGQWDIPNGQRIYKNPYHITVTLDSDEFQYSVDTFGIYNVTVSFELGNYW